VKWGSHARKRTTDAYWRGPLVWNSRAGDFARLHNRRQRVFCASLADVFDNQIDPAWHFDLFLLIKQCDQLDWLLLTKRPQNILKMLPPDWGRGYSNVWIGTTAEDQIRFDQRWPYLAAVPSLVRFISYEPAIGALRLNALGPPHPDWIITGGQSGGRSRELDPQWIRDLISDCRGFGVAPFHKQWGTHGNNPLVREIGLSVADVRARDPYGKGGGLLGNSRECFSTACPDATLPPLSGTLGEIPRGSVSPSMVPGFAPCKCRLAVSHRRI
jgi:protein gp37